MQTLLQNTRAYQLLKTEGQGEGFSHAYLLVFEDGKYLRTALKTFAKLFFDCAKPTTPAQNRISELIDSESFSDCVCFPTEGKKLVVEDAERILEESTLAPVEGDKKLFILSHFDEANVQTQNKLLKLLEEPPKGVYFLLGATSVFPVLTTVLSRTKRLELLPFSIPEVTACLQRIYQGKYDESALSLCAAASGGNVGDACKLLEGGYYQALLDSALSLALAPTHKLPALVKQIGETSHKKELLSLLRLLFRDALLLKTGKRKHCILQNQRLAEVAEKYAAHALIFAQEALSEAEKQVKFNGIFSQCIELCMVKILVENENYKKP